MKKKCLIKLEFMEINTSGIIFYHDINIHIKSFNN